MFVCVFAKKFPALASQSCCEVSRPRAVGEYEYRLLSLVEARTLPVGHCRVVKDLTGPARVKTNFEQNFFASKNM